MDDSMDTPLYRSLGPGEIRLLMLYPGADGTPIYCQLIHAFLDATSSDTRLDLVGPSKVDFQALSYTWGSVEPEVTIYIQNRKVLVRSNLQAALQATRDKDAITIIWVDALCINQQDVLERNAQVAIMGTIFTTARRVLVWLGETEDCSDILLDNFSELWFPRRTNPMDWDGRHQLLHDALEALCSRPYWRRVWIIQEVLIASDLLILCGTRRVPWNSLFQKVVSDSYSLTPSNLDESPPGYIIAMYRGGEGSKHTLPDLLHLCHLCGSQSEDTRDRIYGILGVVSNTYGIVPDYSFTIPQLYITAVQACLNRGIDNRSVVDSLQGLLHNPLWDAKSQSFIETSLLDNLQNGRYNLSKQTITISMNTVAKVELVGPIMSQSALSTNPGFHWAGTSSNSILKKIFNCEKRVEPQPIPLRFQAQQAILFHQIQELGGVYRATIGPASTPESPAVSFDRWKSAKSLGRSARDLPILQKQ